MAKILNYAFFILLLYSCNVNSVQPTGIINTGSFNEFNSVEYVQVQQPVKEAVIEYPKLTDVYESQIGVREKTGNNDGVDVEKYLKSTGLGKGNPWCAAFVHWCLNQAGIKNNITAWSPTAYDKNKIVYKNGWKKEFKPGHVFTLYYANLKRIGHTGFVNKKVNSTVVETVEGNTNPEGSREGGGVYKRKRSLNSLYAICDWY